MNTCTICGGLEHTPLPPSTPESIVIEDLLVEPLSTGWCLHSSQPHSGWIDLYETKDEALAEARALLDRRKRPAQLARGGR